MMLKTIAVIGGGTAGLTAAVGLAKAGYPVVLIEKNRLGGECANTGCVPSKSLLHHARELASLRNCLSQMEGVTPQQLAALLGERTQKALQAVRHTREVFREKESRQWLEQEGVALIEATATFTGKKSLALNHVQYVSEWVDRQHPEVVKENFLFFDRCIICTGSRPALSGIFGLDKVSYYTTDTIFEIEQIPEHLLIIGNGPVGVEMANAFANLGAAVSVVGKEGVVLKNKVDREIAIRLQEMLKEKGVNFIKGRVTAVASESRGLKLTTETGKSISGTALLLAGGRLPNTQLNLEKAEVRYHKRGIKINKYSQTSTDHIYALGDCCPVPAFTHFAYYQAKRLVAHLAIHHFTKLPLPLGSFQKRKVPAVIYTDYEVGQYGYTEEKARKKWGESVEVHYLDFKELDRAMVEGSQQGMIKLVCKGPLARMVGVSILAPRAGEMLPEFQRLISGRNRLSALDDIIRAYPTYTSSLDELYTKWLLKKLPMMEGGG